MREARVRAELRKYLMNGDDYGASLAVIFKKSSLWGETSFWNDQVVIHNAISVESGTRAVRAL